MEINPTNTAENAVPPGCDSLAKLFVLRVEERGDATAICDKRHGIWHSISWREYGDRARTIAMGLDALGMGPGDVVNILAESVPEWLFADMGAICAGCVSVGIYPTSSRGQVRYIVNDSGARVIFVEDEEQLDKVLERRAEMPSLAHIIVFDMDGLHHFSDPMVMSLDDLAALGRDRDASHPEAWATGLAAAQPGQAAIIVYTSGTTARPRARSSATPICCSPSSAGANSHPPTPATTRWRSCRSATWPNDCFRPCGHLATAESFISSKAPTPCWRTSRKCSRRCSWRYRAYGKSSIRW